MVIYASKKKGILLDKIDPSKPQKLHKEPVPRGGGIGIFVAFTLGILFFSDKEFYFYLILSALPVFLIGIFEDIKGDIPPKKRLIFMVLGAVLAIISLNSIIYSIGFFNLPLFFALPFTVFAIVGLTNAINMIDGFNGLSTGITVIALFLFAIVIYSQGDLELFYITLFLAGAVLGFYVLNFPFGKIFLGDGGAYFLGFILAVLSILMVNRNPEISPWFPVVVLAYPIFDVLFAIFRRKFIHGVSPFTPDKFHLHSLIYKKITKNNPLTSIVIYLFTLPFVFLSFVYYSNTYILFLFFLIFCLLYLLFYYVLSKDTLLKKQ
ncbi:MraY family glycosyltransferase [Persephonella sp.]